MYGCSFDKLEIIMLIRLYFKKRVVEVKVNR